MEDEAPECSLEQDRHLGGRTPSCQVLLFLTFVSCLYIQHTPVRSPSPVQNLHWEWGLWSNTVEGEAAVPAGGVPKALTVTSW